jgi:hypothetical protein
MYRTHSELLAQAFELVDQDFDANDYPPEVAELNEIIGRINAAEYASLT